MRFETQETDIKSLSLLSLFLALASLLGCPSDVDGNNTLPDVPQNLAAIAGNGSITLTWDPVAGASDYTLHWGLTEEMGKDSGRIENVESPYVDTDVSNGVRFYYAISSEASGNDSLLSDVVSALPDLGATTPGAPGNASAISTSGGIEISWTTVPGAIYYSVYKDRDSGVTPQTGTPVVGVENPFVDDEAESGETWHYVVTATTETGESPYSAEASATMSGGGGGGDPPEIPTGLSATAGDAEIVLSWDTAQGATAYDIFFDTSTGVSTLSQQLSSVASPYTHTGLSNGTAYYYVVVARNGNGASDVSAEVAATPQDGLVAPPITPQNLIATPGDGHITLSWSESPGAAGYVIYVNTDPGGISMLNATTSPYSHTGLTNGQIYYYAMLAFGEGGDSALTDEVDATPQDGLGQPPTHGTISATLPAGIHAIAIFENFDDGGGLFQVQIMNGDAISGTPVDGLNVSISGEAEGGLTATGGGTGTYQGVVNTPFGPGSYGVNVSGSVTGSLSMTLNDIPTCVVSTPSAGANLPINTDLNVVWVSSNSDKALIQLEDSQGTVQYPALGPPDPQGAILPGVDIPYAGSLKIMIRATWQAEPDSGNADLIFFGDCATTVNLQ
jgi:fibronectin type 3 domain-containing protein